MTFDFCILPCMPTTSNAHSTTFSSSFLVSGVDNVTSAQFFLPSLPLPRSSWVSHVFPPQFLRRECLQQQLALVRILEQRQTEETWTQSPAWSSDFSPHKLMVLQGSLSMKYLLLQTTEFQDGLLYSKTNF